ncbi:hypothetical protein SH2C18_39120 [Clostridium sediminicola]|uniref:methyl-accepting chemotaxis protein n=1 Tax=Clostridium sediminicola TaxID=3114879 RepID=UPI0031F211DC
MFNFFRKSIARKLSVTIAIIVFIIFLVTGFLIYNNTRTRLVDDIKELISLKSNMVVKDVASIFEEVKIISNQAISNSEISGYLKDVQNREDIKTHPSFEFVVKTLSNIKQKNLEDSEGTISGAWIANYEGNFFLGAEGDVSDEKYDVKTRPWYSIANAADGVAFTSPYEYNGKLSLSGVQAVRDNNKEVGMVSIEISLDSIPGLMEEHKIGKKGKNILVSSDGTYIYTDDKKKVIKEKATDDPILKEYVTAALNGGSDVKKVKYNGINYYLAYEPIDINGWAIISLINEAEMMAPIKGAIWALIVTFVLGCIALITLSYFAISKNIKPIRNLVEASNKIAVGDIDVSVKSASKDEIGVLSNAFEKMVVNVKQYAYAIEKIAAGDLSIEVKPSSQKDVLGNSIKSVVETLRNLIYETETLTHAAVEGKFEMRGNINKFNGGYKEIVEGINGTLDTVVEKIYWYEGILDSIPNPISVTDLDMNWTFMNKALIKHLDVNREDVIGKHCSNWNADICNTEKCSIARLKNNFDKTRFDQNDNNYIAAMSYLYNKAGDKTGHVEVVLDITEEHRKKNYQKTEVERLAHNLDLLSEGNLTLNFNVAEADKYTEEDRENFVKINDSFKAAIESISTNVGEVSKILSEISDGNLDVETTVEYKGDFTEIETSLNNIINSLNGILLDINIAADQVASGSNQVSDSSMSLSQGATEQASSVEQLTASIEEIASQIKQNAQNAQNAKEITEEAKVNATLGNTEMEKMLQSMAEINKSSNNISKIIKVIDEIAFQTNILALNAAVEAARAGEHGKGFAVVAEEVRNLASRSANAAKETTALIEGSINKVQEGTKIAYNTAEALNKIVEGASKAADLVGNIAIASNEQAVGVNQINGGINQIANVVQTTSATSEETASASEELSSQAEMLKNQVGNFILKEKNKTIINKEIENSNY